jgi:nicotinate-nucleotide pyrophosphorylase (carboxylating)
MDRAFDVSAHREILRRFLEEDIGRGDVTTLSVIPPHHRAVGDLVAKMPLVLGGIGVAVEVFRLLDEQLAADIWHHDGESVAAGQHVASIRGRARALLTGERVAINLLQRMSGIATLTRKFVDAVRGTGVKILDTRKTTPGLRVFEKYAVTVGGGLNHRFGLDDAVLIKDNHVRIAGGVAAAIGAATNTGSAVNRLEIEVTDLEELQQAIMCGVRTVLLDNMSAGLVRDAVRLVRARPGGNEIIVEASGGITLANVRQFAEAGVDWISVGALTHSAPAVDVSLEIRPASPGPCSMTH